MRARSAGLLAALGVLAVAGGWYFGTQTTPSEQTSVAGGKANVLIVGGSDILPSPGTIDTMQKEFTANCPGCTTTVAGRMRRVTSSLTGSDLV